MKKITKLMLTLAMLFGVAGGVNSVKATKLYADLSKLGNGPVSTWNGETNTMTWKAKSNNMISNFDFAAGDYTQCTKIGVDISSYTNADRVRVQIRANGQEKTVSFVGTGIVEKSLIDDFKFSVADLEKFEWARLLGSSYDDSNTVSDENPASAVISQVYLEVPTQQKNVDLSKMAANEGSATWDKDNKKFAWTAQFGNAITLPGLSGNLSAYTTINYETTAGSCNHFRILIYYSNGTQNTYNAEVGTKSVTFESMGVNAMNLASVSSIKIAGASDATGDITLTSFSLEGPEVNYIKAYTTYQNPDGTKDLKELKGTNINWKLSYPVTVNNETIVCGDGNGSNEGTHVTITDYDYLTFVVSSVSADAKTGLRVWVWDGTDVVTLYPHLEAEYATVENWTETNFITSPGVYVVKVSGYNYFKGIKALQSWAGNAGTITISAAYASKGVAPTKYVPSGKYTLIGETKGSSNLTAALADAAATSFDATGLTNTSAIELAAANPNALFVAGTGKLSNTKNVIVSDVCANLELTDGHPFKAPAAFTATNAKFTKTVSDAGFATMVVPFAVASLPTGVEAYNLTDVDGETITKTDAAALEADKPVLVKAAGGEYEFTATGAAIAATADGEVSNGLLKASYAGTTATADATNYVLQKNGDEVNFYKVTGTAATVKPFRAYLTAPTTAPVLYFDLFGGETTGVNDVTTKTAAVKGDFYNLNGQRISQPTKGLYIVGGKKVIFK